LLPDSDDIFEEKIVSLHDLLAGTFPEATNYLLAANLGKKGRSENKNIIWDEITNYRDAEDYRISPRGWAELFDRNGFTLCSDRRPLTHSGAFMENDSNTELTVEEIMGRIKEEVACKKNERVASSAAEGRQRIQNSLFAPPVTEQENPVFTMLKKLQAVAANLPFYPFVHVFAKKLKTVIPRSQEVILIEDLCEYEDESFIMTAYRSILSRDPDDEGLDRFSTLLRNDQISKVEIIGRIRYSWEGRKGRVRVKGLFFRFAVAILLRAPIIGRILRKIASARVKK
jgi:CRISPR/Cas system-associated endoribonuclease Cas2